MFLLWLIFAGGILLGIWVYLGTKENQKAFQTAWDNTPEINEKVKAFCKTTKTSGGNWVSNGDESGGGYTSSVTTQHFISFEFPDKSRKSFEVGAEEYILITENDAGVLTYKEYGGNLYFIGFKHEIER